MLNGYDEKGGYCFYFNNSHGFHELIPRVPLQDYFIEEIVNDIAITMEVSEGQLSLPPPLANI